MRNIDKLKKAFLAKNQKESEKIELDNLDYACLIKVKGEVKVCNEHGTTFEVDELSATEIRIFLFSINQ